MSTAALPRPYIQRNRAILWVGDVRDMLRSLPAESVQCVVTSPPYWGLRSYGTEPQVWGGEPNCEHEWLEEERRCQTGGDQTTSLKQISNKGSQIAKVAGIVGTCSRCGAWRGELGLEPTPELFVEHIVEVFREVRRVLRSDGSAWVNLGDSYAGTKVGNTNGTGVGGISTGKVQQKKGVLDQAFTKLLPPGLKPKDMVGIPWRVAFALQADGWWLRSDIIWHKPNPMPESVTDRPTKSHEYLFLFSKRSRYFYDADAIKEPAVCSSTMMRNKCDVWTINTQPFPEAHFATFPEELPELCIKAGCPEGGIVLDPFAGSGTTLLVAQRLGRIGWGIELKPEYADIAARRLAQEVLPL